MGSRCVYFNKLRHMINFHLFPWERQISIHGKLCIFNGVTSLQMETLSVDEWVRKHFKL
jgi:hypothetical protein